MENKSETGVKLLLKMAAILGILLIVCGYYTVNEYALADENRQSATKNDSINTDTDNSDIEKTLDNVSDGKTDNAEAVNREDRFSDSVDNTESSSDEPISQEMNKEGIPGIENNGGSDRNPEEDAAGVSDVDSDNNEGAAGNPEEDAAGVSDVDSDNNEGAAGNPEEDAAGVSDTDSDNNEESADESEENKPVTAESLLCTGAYYNEETVKGAMLPTDSNDDRYRLITGKAAQVYHVGQMPAGYKSSSEAKKQMVTFDVPVWKMNKNGEKYSSTWSITINKELADSVKCIFSDIYQLDIKFPFNRLVGYAYRKVGGVGLMNSTLMSAHSFGVAIDINLGDYDNDYFLGKGNDLRNKDNPYCIPDEVIEIFERYGWFWGGNFEICSDTMHFQYFELGFLQYETEEPFPVLYYGASNMDKDAVKNLQQRLEKLGYLTKTYSSFNKKVKEAVEKFQEDRGLEVTGIVDYATWEPLINLTHDMSYVF